MENRRYSVGLTDCTVGCNGVSVATLDPTPRVLLFKAHQVVQSATKDRPSSSRELPLDVILSFRAVNHTTELGVIYKFAEGVLNPTVYAIDKGPDIFANTLAHKMKLKPHVDKNIQAQIEPDKQTSMFAPATEEVPEDLRDLGDHFMRKLINMYAIKKESTKITYSLGTTTDQRGKPFAVLVEVTYFTSLSRQQEFEGNTKSVIPLFSVTYFLTITFAVISCLRLSCIRNNIWLASCGVLSSGLAVLSSFGLMLFCGVPFVVTVANAPFLILGVGVDDMFIMIASWEQSSRKKEKSSVKSLLAETYAEAALSVTITTLTDVLAFFIGTWTAFPSVRSFCLYTGTAFVFCYVYTMTFFGAVLVLNHKREQENRHWLTCMRVGVGEDQAENSCLYNACCIGSCSRQPSQPEGEHPMSIFFKKYYGPFITNKWIKLLVVLLYGAYLGGSVYGCTQIREGIDLRNLANDDSYVIPYYDDDEKYFSTYGPRVMVVITESVDYWNETVRLGIESCAQNLENISYVDKNLSESWLRVYTELAKRGLININSKTDFFNNLPVLFKFRPSFEWDINKTQDAIEASRFFIQTVNVTSAVDEKNLLNQLREAAEQCSIPLKVYHPAFIYYDQYLVIVQNTVQNVAVAAGAMLVVSLLLIPNPLCCLWVTFAIASVIVGVAGFMTFWNVNLDSISMINLVICIGFSVDFSAHISYAFVASGESSANKRAIEALSLLGYPVLQGAVSTILGVVVLAAANTYIFRTFFKIMFLVILFGALHGLVFIPVFLTFFGNFGRSPNSKSKNLELEKL
ncbi:PREDICTED: patched domain-containing protein 3 [Corvus brachyrhynchos]|uniref:patched domain-containing protein 3 n=1 Tax=Corvus brachyrhynchos TaxID=85066 RepID=UPI0004DDF8BD|nr:PREDICTED: patched domain-containing protein 3 [Corvus brachyrhynchos]